MKRCARSSAISLTCALVAAASLSIGASACGTVGGVAFVRAYAAGDRSFSAGRFTEAAERYAAAAEISERPRDRDEATYARADALVRAEKIDEALALFDALSVDAKPGERSTRAKYRAAVLRLERGERARALAALTEILHTAPEHGVARQALALVVGDVEAREGKVAAIAYEEALFASVATTRLGEETLYDASVRHEALGETKVALAGFLACAERFPYPQGALFDDALWHASLLHEQLGDAAAAVADLARLLAVREVSYVSGSYNRPRMSAAQFRIGELQRDRLGDHASARVSFHRVYMEHPSSTLRARALFEESALAAADGDRGGACATVDVLLHDFPDTRVARKADENCPAAKARVDALKGARDDERRRRSEP